MSDLVQRCVRFWRKFWSPEIYAPLAAMRPLKRMLCAMVLGVGVTAALPPVFLVPLLVPAISLFLVLLRTAPNFRRAWIEGWAFGFGACFTGFYWITISLFTDLSRFGWFIPFPLFGLAGGLALFSAFAAWGAYRFRHDPLRLSIAFALMWMVAEYARGHVLTGFPWNLIATAWGISAASIQSVSLVGPYALGGITVLLAALPGLWLHPDIDCRRAARWNVAAFAVLLAIVSWGQWRVMTAEQRYVDGVMLRLVQANIAQHHKWDPQLQMDGVRRHIALTHEPGYDRITHVIWPETALPYLLSEASPWPEILAQSAPQSGGLITGALRSEGEGESFHIWNSVQMIDHAGRIVQHYDKARLVPFGEFVPFRSVLPFKKITEGGTDFSAGPGAQALPVTGAPPASFLVCYEAIFPDYRPSFEASPRAEWIVNVTNDAWFGRSSGPYQHLEAARFRAVEQGIAVVRVANTGISAVIDPYGRIEASLPLGVAGILDSRLPAPAPGATLYARFGDAMTIGAMLLLLLGLFAIRVPAPRD